MPRPRSLLLVAAVVAPFAIGVGQVALATRHPFFTWGDQALIDMSVRNARSFDQLTGAYSRLGWNHPGPLYFYLLAPVYPLVGSALRLYLGALVLNGVAAATAVGLAARFADRRTALAVALGTTAYLFCLGPTFLRDPWNPAVIALPLLTAVVAVAVRSSTRTTCVAVVAGSLVVQAHVGALGAVLTLALVAAAVHVAVTIAWEGHPRTLAALVPSRRSVALVVLVGTAAWLPPLVEQLAHGRDGNLGRVARFLLDSEGQQRSLGVAADLAASASWLPSVPFLVPPPEPPVPGLVVIAAAVALAAAGVALAWRRRDRAALVLCAYAAVGFPVTTLSIARITGEVYVYLLWWMPVNVLALGTGLLLLVATRERLLAAGVALATTATVVATVVGPPMSDLSRPQTGRAWALLAPRLDGSTSVYLDIRDEGVLAHAAGLAVLLDERDIGYAVPERYERLFPVAEDRVDGGALEVTLASADPAADPASLPGELVPGPTPFTLRTVGS